MSDTTWGVKMSDDQKVALTNAIDQSGLSSKEFMGELLKNFELNRAKEALPILCCDFDELQKIVSRIYSIYLGIGQRIDTELFSKNAEYVDLALKKEILIKALQGEVEELRTLDEAKNS